MQLKDNPDFSTKPSPVSFAPEDTVRQALNVMCDKNIGSIVVLKSDRTLAGIVTERDMMIRVLGKGVNPDTTPLSQIMSTQVRVASETDQLVDWMRAMSNERFRHLPVVNAQGQVVNVISQGDLMAYTWPSLYEKLRQDLTGRFAKRIQIALIGFAALTLALIALGM